MMTLWVNGKKEHVKEGLLLLEAKRRFAPKSDVTILDGFQTEENLPLHENAQLTFLKKGALPSREELEHMLCARHSPAVHEKIKKAVVGIAGLGGLGSNIAELLCRTGVGKLVLVDFDVVEPSNLNRQNYRICHLGMAKTDALREQLCEMNPYVELETHMVRVEETNVAALFGNCHVLCEAFDRPQAKAMLVTTALEQLPKLPVVASSGMAGLQSANQIFTQKRMKNLYLCGDGETAAAPGQGLMAPRVSVCAGHQANMALRLLTGQPEP